MVIIPTASENASLALLPSFAAMASFSVCNLVSVKKQAIKITVRQKAYTGSCRSWGIDKSVIEEPHKWTAH